MRRWDGGRASCWERSSWAAGRGVDHGVVRVHCDGDVLLLMLLLLLHAAAPCMGLLDGRPRLHVRGLRAAQAHGEQARRCASRPEAPPAAFSQPGADASCTEFEFEATDTRRWGQHTTPGGRSCTSGWLSDCLSAALTPARLVGAALEDALIVWGRSWRCTARDAASSSPMEAQGEVRERPLARRAAHTSAPGGTCAVGEFFPHHRRVLRRWTQKRSTQGPRSAHIGMITHRFTSSS